MENTNIGCGACRDLLPLYADGVANSESSALLEAHIAACEDCRAELARLKTVLPMVKKSPQKAMRTVKQKLRIRRVLIGAGSGLGAVLLLAGLFAFLINYTIPVKTPPKDLKCGVENGVFTASSQVDSQLTGVRLYPYKAKDGSDIFVVLLSMGNPPLRRLWPALNRRILYPSGSFDGFWYPEQGLSVTIDLAGPSMPPMLPMLISQVPSIPYEYYGFLDPLEPLEPLEPPEYWAPWEHLDYNPEGKGLWLVYFVRERDIQLGRIQGDSATGRLAARSMQYATLVWEETIE